MAQVRGESRRGQRASRRGAALVMFAMIVFALMGIAAVAIDLGLASLTQVQMQTAVDTAALEGVQLRDFHEYRHLSNKYRRPRAAELVRMVFDDDMHPTGGIVPGEEGAPGLPPDDEDRGNFGAGPIVTLTQTPGMEPGISSLLGTTPAVYDDPDIQPNLANQKDGDLVSGRFEPDPDLGSIEFDDYSRTDYEHAGDLLEARKALAFLVRMRRSNDPGDMQAGVATSAPTLPFLFGTASTVQSADGGSYDPRVDGITVRATAIAAARPALAVGPHPIDEDGNRIPSRAWPTSPDRNIRGVTPFALSAQFWTETLTYNESSNEGEQRLVTITDFDADGYPDLVHGGTSLIGRWSKQTSPVGTEVVSELVSIPSEYTSINWLETYFPIYDEIEATAGGTTERIVGYGYGKVRLSLVPGQLILRKGIFVLDEAAQGGQPACNVIVAADNASAHLSSVATATLELSDEEWERVFARHVEIFYRSPGPGLPPAPSYRWQNIQPGTLLAPALVR